MSRVALKILFHDRAKYYALVLGIAFSTLLIAQQAAIFWCAIDNGVQAIREMTEANVWVMKPAVEFIDMSDPMAEITLTRVRSVEGLAWAVPWYQAVVVLRSADGLFKSVLMVGLDDQSLTGAPRKILLGRIEDLVRQDAIAIDEAGYQKLFPGKPLELGGEFEIGRRRATLVAIYRSRPNFNGQPMVVARRSQAVQMARESDKTVSYIVARSAPGRDPEEVARRISAETGLKALTATQFADLSTGWLLKYSGITEVLGTTIVLGFIVGVAIVGQTFHLFSVENMRQFAALKAIGIGNGKILGMVLLQAVTVSALGYGLGIGLAALFFIANNAPSSAMRGMYLPDFINAGTAGLIFLMVLASSVVSARRVLTVDPALVFRG
jgi:putative ABC transport system permease protein